MSIMLTRRALFVSFAVLPALAPPAEAATSSPKLLVHKDPNCGCCDGWVEHLRAAGFVADVADVAEAGAINRVKARLGVPNELASCHTAELAGYVIEGHVPAASIKRLLAERPEARGLAVPGMPIGSPGMEVPGSPDEEYAVILFGSFGQSQFSRYRGIHELSR